jgi:hypothetical protein
MLDQCVQSVELGIADHKASDAFLKKLAAALQAHRKNPALVHGFRAQTMFAYMAAALGACKIITEEDSGEFYVASPDFKRPDFRILTNAGAELFVEVKNFHQTDPLTRIPHKPVEQMGGRGVRELENTELYDDPFYRPEADRLY